MTVVCCFSVVYSNISFSFFMLVTNLKPRKNTLTKTKNIDFH